MNTIYLYFIFNKLSIFLKEDIIYNTLRWHIPFVCSHLFDWGYAFRPQASGGPLMGAITFKHAKAILRGGRRKTNSKKRRWKKDTKQKKR